MLNDGDAESSTEFVFNGTPGREVEQYVVAPVGSILGAHGPVGTRIVLTIPTAIAPAMAAENANMAHKALPAIAFH